MVELLNDLINEEQPGNKLESVGIIPDDQRRNAENPTCKRVDGN